MNEGIDPFDVWNSGVDRRSDFAFGQAAGGGHGSWLKLTTAGKRSRWQDRYKGRGVPVTAYISGLGATCTIYVTLFGLETIRKLRLNVPMLSITPFFCKSLETACPTWLLLQDQLALQVSSSGTRSCAAVSSRRR